MQQRRSFHLDSSSQTPIPQDRLSAKSNQLSFLSINYNRSTSMNPIKDLISDRNSTKLSYKYEKKNNSFKLVHRFEANQQQNKENEGSKSRGKENGNANILMALSSLSQRVGKLEKYQRYDEQKQQFNLYKMIQKVVQQNIVLQTSRYFLTVEKRLQKVTAQFTEIKDKVQKLCLISENLPENQIKLEKCPQSSLSPVHDESVRWLKQQVLKINERLTLYQANKDPKNGENYEQNKNKIESLMKGMNENLFQNLETNTKILENYKNDLENMKQSQIKIIENYENLSKKVSQMGSQRKNHTIQHKISIKTKCSASLIAKLIIEMSIKPYFKTQKSQSVPHSSNTQLIIYGVDPNGSLVDSQGYYLYDNSGRIICLSSEQINKLKQLKLIEQKK